MSTAAAAPTAERPAASRRTFGRRSLFRGGLLAAAALPAAVAVDGTLVTPRRLLTTEHVFGSAAGPPLRIAVVTDLHIRGMGHIERLLLERLHEWPADLIAIVGDSVDRFAALPHLDVLLREFPRGPRICAVMGNWEYNCGAGRDVMTRTYERHGVELLVGRFIDVDHAGLRVRITGLDDLLCGRTDIRPAFVGAEPVERHLVLLHCPLHRNVMGVPREHAPALVLAGHSHGGQISPFGRPVFLPHGCGPYVAGWYHRDEPAALYVSRGVGTSGIPVRLGSAPELARIEWRL